MVLLRNKMVTMYCFVDIKLIISQQTCINGYYLFLLLVVDAFGWLTLYIIFKCLIIDPILSIKAISRGGRGGREGGEGGTHVIVWVSLYIRDHLNSLESRYKTCGVQIMKPTPSMISMHGICPTGYLNNQSFPFSHCIRYLT